MSVVIGEIQEFKRKCQCPHKAGVFQPLGSQLYWGMLKGKVR